MMINRAWMRLALPILLASLACSLTSPPPSATVPPPTETSAPEASQALPTVGPTEVPATPTVVHVAMPAESPGSKLFMSDISSAATGAEGRASAGDTFERNRLERPFTADAMSYRPDIDITRGDLTFDDQFFYFMFSLAGTHQTEIGFPATYGVELDLDLDGRGDWLVLGTNPPGSWTSERVRVWLDANDDVGGDTPMQSDGAAGDGYELMLFDSGQGDDPDTAWARIRPGSVPGVELAVKRDVLDDVSFLWSLWASAGPVDPTLFDFVDAYTLGEAGSPVANSPDYPLKLVAGVDNTCRMYQGFTPNGSEPGICAVYGTVQNCTFHPMQMVPGNLILGDQLSSTAIRRDVAPGTYSFYDQNVMDNGQHPLVLTATLQATGLIQIMTDGNGNTYPCP
ncbi:MAG TPA: hypothetical protein VGA52_08895 [Anaerolineales bacterium]|jgi:hypothetical protein